MDAKVWIVVLASSPAIRNRAAQVSWDMPARMVTLGEGGVHVAAFPAEHVRAIYLESHGVDATSAT